MRKDHSPFLDATRHSKKKAPVKESRSARPWRRRRLRILRRDLYTCQKCGYIGHDLEVDHKIPLHKGGTDADDNLQSLCEKCHKFKTAIDLGDVHSTMVPSWIPKSSKPLVLVCGPPASGKSTFIQNHAGKDDLVVDLDLIAAEMGRKMHELTKQERSVMVRIRNDRVAAFCRGETNHPKCWLAATAGQPQHRDFWAERGAEIVIMPTAHDVCERRVMARDLPVKRKIDSIDAIRKWA